MPLADDFQSLLPPREASVEDGRPLYTLFVFDPDTGKATIEANDCHPARAKTHGELCPEVDHPGRIDGYAYKIKRGWRITDDDHKEIEDHFVVAQVLKALREKYPAAPLPNI